jgi:hypothetical protein
MRTGLGYTLAIAISVQGCATTSQDVTTTYVSGVQYQNYDCQQIAAETARIQSRIVEVGGRLDQAAANDKSIAGVGMILFWPALFALGGTKAQEAEFGRLKGEYQALEQVSTQKRCQAGGIVAAADAAPRSEQSSGEQRLLALNDLHRRGLISDDELKTRRAKVLDDIVSQPAPARSASPVALAPVPAPASVPALRTRGVGVGDRLTFIDKDPLSNVSTGTFTLTVSDLGNDKVSFNDGNIVWKRDGTQEKGVFASTYIHSFGDPERATKAKLHVPGNPQDADVSLRIGSVEEVQLAGRAMRVAKYTLTGYTTLAASTFSRPAFGQDAFTGQVWLEVTTGVPVLATIKSNNSVYQLDRRLDRVVQ